MWALGIEPRLLLGQLVLSSAALLLSPHIFNVVLYPCKNGEGSNLTFLDQLVKVSALDTRRRHLSKGTGQSRGLRGFRKELEKD